MHKIVFVTGNKGKFAEVRDILKNFGIEAIQNKDGYPELQEDELEPIAANGAQYVANKLNMPVMVDDSGIFINALNGFPTLFPLWKTNWEPESAEAHGRRKTGSVFQNRDRIL